MSTAYVNGYERSGTHATAKACLLLGVDATNGHVPYPAELPLATHQVFAKRDPRNVLQSSIRAEGLPFAQGVFIARIPRLINALAEYAGWLQSKDVFVVQYERLISDDQQLCDLASYLNVPYLDDAFQHLPGHTRTWNLPHSDWREWWTPHIAEAWKRSGGDSLMERWGYV